MSMLDVSVDVCETLEDLLKILNFRSIVIKNCKFTCFTMCEFFSLLEYYDPAMEIVLAQHISNVDIWKLFCNTLSKCNSLESVTFKDQEMTDQYLNLLLVNLRANSRISSLKFENCDLGDTTYFYQCKYIAFVM